MDVFDAEVTVVRRAGWPASGRAQRTTCRARADGGGLLLVDRRFFPREGITSGVVAAHPNGARVLLGRGPWKNRLELEVASVEQGEAVLRALGLADSQSVETFRILSRAIRGPLLVLATIFGVAVHGLLGGLFMTGAHVLSVLLYAALLLVSVVALAPRKLDVRSNGLVVSSSFASRFLPHARIRSVSEYVESIGSSHRRIQGVDVVLDSGEAVRLPVERVGIAVDRGRTSLVAERVRDAIARTRRVTDTAAASLERGSRERPAWIQSLRSMGTGANAGPRVAPVDVEQLWAVLEDPGASPVARAAAAVALGPDLDPDRRSRLRVAAQSVAVPRLRVVLDHVAEGADDVELLGALGALEEGAAGGGKATP